MKVEKKIALFTEITMNEVNAKRRQIKKETDDIFKDAVDDAVKCAKKQARERIALAQYKLNTEKNREILEAATTAKRNLADKRSKLVEALFAGVMSDIRAYVDSPTYRNSLISYIQAIAADKPGLFSYVQLMERDVPLTGGITSLLTVEPVSQDFVGGFRLISANRRIVDDRSLLRRLEEARRNFTVYAD